MSEKKKKKNFSTKVRTIEYFKMSETINRKIESFLATINRMHQFTEGEEFEHTSRSELTERKNSLRLASEQYRKEHLERKDLSDEDWTRSLGQFNEIEERAIKTLARYQEQINKVIKQQERTSTGNQEDTKALNEQIQSLTKEIALVKTENKEREEKLKDELLAAEGRIKVLKNEIKEANEREVELTNKLGELNERIEAKFELENKKTRAEYDARVAEIIAREKSLLERLERLDRANRESEKGLKDQLKAAQEQLKCMEKDMQMKQDYFVISEAEYRARNEELKKQCDKVMVELRQEREKGEAAPTTSSASRQEQPATVSANVAVSLDQFNGDLNKWPEWKAKYDEQIHSNNDLDIAEKMLKLMDLLSDSAKEFLEQWFKMGTRYEDMYRLLNETFSSKYKYMIEHLNALERYQPTNDSEVENIKNLTILAERTINSLFAAECPRKEWEGQLVRMIIARMTTGSRNEWEAAFIGTAMPRFTEVIQYLKKRANELVKPQAPSTLERSTERQNTGAIPRTNLSAVRQQPTEQQNVRMNYVRNDESRVQNEPVGGCHNCGQSHKVRKCPELTKLEPHQLKRKLRQLKLCVNCLSPHHHEKSMSCQGGTCKGGKRHNTMLCDESCQEIAMQNSANNEGNHEFRERSRRPFAPPDENWD